MERYLGLLIHHVQNATVPVDACLIPHYDGVWKFGIKPPPPWWFLDEQEIEVASKGDKGPGHLDNFERAAEKSWRTVTRHNPPTMPLTTEVSGDCGVETIRSAQAQTRSRTAGLLYKNGNPFWIPPATGCQTGRYGGPYDTDVFPPAGLSSMQQNLVGQQMITGADLSYRIMIEAACYYGKVHPEMWRGGPNK